MQRRKKSTDARKMKNAAIRRDATLREFEKQDLGDDIATTGAAVVVRPQRPTSILLSDELKEALRRRGRDVAAPRCQQEDSRLVARSLHLQYLFVPSLVLYAFGIEVGFKALALQTSGVAPRGHDLDALFRALPTQLQAQIVADTNATYPGSEPYFDRDLAMVRRRLRSLALCPRAASCRYRPRIPATPRPCR